MISMTNPVFSTGSGTTQLFDLLARCELGRASSGPFFSVSAHLLPHCLDRDQNVAEHDHRVNAERCGRAVSDTSTASSGVLHRVKKSSIRAHGAVLGQVTAAPVASSTPVCVRRLRLSLLESTSHFSSGFSGWKKFILMGILTMGFRPLKLTFCENRLQRGCRAHKIATRTPTLSRFRRARRPESRRICPGAQ